MTKIITRYFESTTAVNAVLEELEYRQRVSSRNMRVFDTADGLTATLGAYGTQAETAQAYESRLSRGGAVLLVVAGFKPLGVAQTTRDVTAAMGAVDIGPLSEEGFISETGRSSLSVMRDHRHMMTRAISSSRTRHHMADWPIPLISRRKPFTGSIFDTHAHMASWPIGHLSDGKPYTDSIFPRHARMANFPIGLLSNRKPFTGSIFSRHARMANFPIGLISKRKPFTGSIFPRHRRMANWPFPLLINGKMGQNALMPGAPRMANFPIGLISKRKPFTGSIFSRHARMAKFPIGLLSKRKPFTGSIFSRHARMADMILPLVIRRGGDDGGSLAGASDRPGLLSLPTIIRR